MRTPIALTLLLALVACADKGGPPVDTDLDDTDADVIGDTQVDDTVVADSDTDDTVVADSDTDDTVVPPDTEPRDTEDTLVVGPDSDDVAGDTDTLVVDTEVLPDTDTDDAGVETGDSDTGGPVDTEPPVDTDPTPTCGVDAWEPDAPVSLDAEGAWAILRGRTLSDGDLDVYEVTIPTGCAPTLSWSHDGGEAVGHWTVLLDGSVSASGNLAEAGTEAFPPAVSDTHATLILEGPADVCLTYDFTFERGCPGDEPAPDWSAAVDLVPDPAYTDEDLRAVVSDLPAGATVAYTWTRVVRIGDPPGAVVVDEDGPVLDASLTEKMDLWQVAVTVVETDGTTSSDEDITIVLDAPATLASATIVEDGDPACVTLRCEVTFDDPDGGTTPSLGYTWTVDGVELPATDPFTGGGPELFAALADGDVVTCTPWLSIGFPWPGPFPTIAPSSVSGPAPLPPDTGFTPPSDTGALEDPVVATYTVVDASRVDADADGTCGGDDLCHGDDATGDTDVDGVCDDLDACDGDDASGDADGDGLCADTEAVLGTSDARFDSDGDGLDDAAELAAATDPVVEDTDGDGLLDGDEVAAGFDPLTPAPYVARRVFVGSLGVDGDVGGYPAGPDLYCRGLADAADLTGLYVALVSTNTVPVSARLDDGVLYRRVDGLLLARDRADLLDQSLYHPVLLDETGAEVHRLVFTGSSRTGGSSLNRTCSDWSENTSGQALTGQSWERDWRWLAYHEDFGCSNLYGFYCVEVADQDGDGLSDADEARLGTDPAAPDTDVDGLSDGDEVYVWGTDPLGDGPL